MRSLRDHILLINYQRSDEWAGMVFAYKTTCPNCDCEFVFILKEGKIYRKFSCQRCGQIFREKKRLAA